MIHTIVSQDVLYEGIDQLQLPEEVMVNGMLMQIERVSATKARIIRLISSEPSAYLNPSLCPGQEIDLSHMPQ